MRLLRGILEDLAGWSIRRRLGVTFAAFFTPYAVFGALGLAAFYRIDASVDHMLHDATVELPRMAEAELALAAFQEPMLRFLRTADRVERDEARLRLAQFQSALEALLRTPFHHPGEHEVAEILKTQAAVLAGRARELLGDPAGAGDPRGLTAVVELDDLMRAARDSLNRMQDVAGKEMIHNRGEVVTVLRRMRLAVAAGLLISVGAAGILAVLFARWINRPIRALGRASRALAAGDLSRRVDTAVGGELGETSRAFNHMAAELEALHRALADRVRELEAALAQVKQLRGLLPICAGCKKVRREQDYWQQIEAYVTEHTEARFSHGLCPECRARGRAELEQWKRSRAAEPTDPEVAGP